MLMGMYSEALDLFRCYFMADAGWRRARPYNHYVLECLILLTKPSSAERIKYRKSVKGDSWLKDLALHGPDGKAFCPGIFFIRGLMYTNGVSVDLSQALICLQHAKYSMAKADKANNTVVQEEECPPGCRDLSVVDWCLLASAFVDHCMLLRRSMLNFLVNMSMNVFQSLWVKIEILALLHSLPDSYDAEILRGGDPLSNVSENATAMRSAATALRFKYKEEAVSDLKHCALMARERGVWLALLRTGQLSATLGLDVAEGKRLMQEALSHMHLTFENLDPSNIFSTSPLLLEAFQISLN